MKLSARVWIAVFTVLIGLGWNKTILSPQLARAESHFKGKTVQIIVGASAGGFSMICGDVFWHAIYLNTWRAPTV